MPTLKTLNQKVECRVARKRDAAFTPRDFADLANADPISRALRKLVAAGRLVRLGYGVYGRAKRSALAGQVMLGAPNGFVGASRQPLTKLGVSWQPSEVERDENAARSTRVPLNPVVNLTGPGATLPPQAVLYGTGSHP